MRLIAVRLPSYSHPAAHELHEAVEPVIHLKQAKYAGNTLAVAVDSAHAVAFHSGLGQSLYPTTSTSGYLSEHSAAAFAESAYVRDNIAVVADGASRQTVSKWVDRFFKGVPTTSHSKLPLNITDSKYYGGEQRTASSGGNALVIGFSSAALGSVSPEISVLVALLGGTSSIKWSPGFSLLAKAAAAAPGSHVAAVNLAYGDAGLLTIQITGGAQSVRKAAEESVKALKSVVEGAVAKEDLTKAIAKAKFDALTTNELTGAGLISAGTSILNNAKPFQVAEAIKSLEAVTADKVKAVSSTPPFFRTVTKYRFRLPRRYWTGRRRWPWLEIFTCCRMQKSLASRYRRVGAEPGKRVQQNWRCRAASRPSVHISSHRLHYLPTVPTLAPRTPLTPSKGLALRTALP